MLDSPTAAIDVSATTDEDTEVQVPLEANDVEGDALIFAIAQQPESNMGTVTLNGSVATFTPAPDFRGVVTFTCKASDGNSESNEATATVQVASINDAPIAQDQSASGDEDTPTLTLHASDVDGDALTFSVKAQPADGAGTVTITGDQAKFTPSPAFVGRTTFTFEASDGMASSTATLTLDPAPIHSTGGGCGCGTADSGPILWIAAIALAALATRRRRAA